MSVIIHLTVLLLISLICAIIGFAFNKVQEPNMILHPYNQWLEYLDKHKFKSFRFRLFEFKLWFKLNTTFVNATRDHIEYLSLHKDKWFNDSAKYASKESKLVHYLVKPLGLCMTCNTFWIGIIGAILIFNKMLVLNSFIVGMISIGIVLLLERQYNHN